MTNAIATIDIGGMQVPTNIANLYRETANVGMENVEDGSLPQLKPIEEKSRALLHDGSKPKVGSLYYSPTKEAFDKVRVSLVAVSKGYWTTKVDHKGETKFKPDGTPETKFNQLLGGVLLETMQPFVMFSSGVRWKTMNDFVKSIKPLTKNKVAPVPMYALQVDLTTKLTETENYAVEYNLAKDVNGVLKLIVDEEEINFLLEASEKLNESINSFVERNEVDRYTGQKLIELERELTATDVSSSLGATPVDDHSDDSIVYQDFNSKDIPF